MALSTDELYERSLALSKENNDDNFLELAKTLRQLYDRDRDQYTKVQGKTDLAPRKAYYMVEISRAFEPLQIARSKLREAGWTKLGLLAKHVKQDNVEELVELAINCTVEQLKTHLKGEKPMDNSHVVTGYFSPKDYPELEEALLKFGASRSGRGLVNKEQAIMKMVRKLKTASA